MIAHYTKRWRSLPGRQRAMLLVLAAAVALANVAQPYPEVAPLQHIPAVILITAAPWLMTRWPLSNRAIGATVAFLLLHTFAARWTYSNVPYDEWIRALTGHAIGPVRNNFDRLVHFSFGILAVPVLAEAVRRHGGASPRMAGWIAVLFVGAASALYEVVEWGLSMAVPADLAADYNGQQGDLWDAQKDMALAMAGGVLAAIFGRFRTDR